MVLNPNENKRDALFKKLLLINVVTISLWIVAQTIDVYRYTIVGAIYELLWLPMVATIIVLPFVFIYLWYKDRFNIRSKFLLLLVLYVVPMATLFMLT